MGSVVDAEHNGGCDQWRAGLGFEAFEHVRLMCTAFSWNENSIFQANSTGFAASMKMELMRKTLVNPWIWKWRNETKTAEQLSRVG